MKLGYRDRDVHIWSCSLQMNNFWVIKRNRHLLISNQRERKKKKSNFKTNIIEQERMK